MSIRIIVSGILLCVTIAIVNAAPSSKLPKGFKQCSISDPNFDECVRSGIQSAIPYLANGIPSLGIVKVDPLHILTLKVDQSNGGPVNLKLNFKDLDLHNMRFVQMTKAHYDPVNYSLYVEMVNPKTLLLEGDYEMSGQALILPLVGDGKCKINLDLSKVVGDVKLKPVEKNGKTYMEVVSLKWKFTPTKLVLKFDNLFNGSNGLGDNMNVFLNENWREILAELQPAIEEVFAVAFREVLQQFLNRIPANQIFVD